MVYQVLCALGSGAIAVGLILFFARMDEELPAPKVPIFIMIGALSSLCVMGISLRLSEGLPISLAVFTAYLAFVVYTDACIHKVYSLVNLVMLVAMAVLYVVSQWGVLEPIVFIMAGVFWVLGLAGAYGRGDGYVLATTTLAVGMMSKGSYMSVLFVLMMGCGIFVIYSIVDYVYRRHRKKEAIRFFKVKRPLLPSMGAGVMVGLMILG